MAVTAMGCTGGVGTQVFNVGGGDGTTQAHLNVYYTPTDDGAPTLDLLVDGNHVIAYDGSAVSLPPWGGYYFALPPGRYDVALAGLTPVSYTLDARQQYTLIYCAGSSALEQRFFHNDVAARTDGTTLVRVVNINQSYAPMDVEYTYFTNGPYTRLATLAVGEFVETPLPTMIAGSPQGVTILAQSATGEIMLAHGVQAGLTSSGLFALYGSKYIQTPIPGYREYNGFFGENGMGGVR
jgi:hypothetical protein